jgi:hypothetical protein
MPQIPDNMVIGGTGIDFYNKLPDEIENAPMDWEIYPNTPFHYGFSMKGCRFSCSFCCVPTKEGRPYNYNTIDELITFTYDKFKGFVYNLYFENSTNNFVLISSQLGAIVYVSNILNYTSKPFNILTYYTGAYWINEKGKYIGTYQLAGLVHHVFVDDIYKEEYQFYFETEKIN